MIAKPLGGAIHADPTPAARPRMYEYRERLSELVALEAKNKGSHPRPQFARVIPAKQSQ